MYANTFAGRLINLSAAASLSLPLSLSLSLSSQFERKYTADKTSNRDSTFELARIPLSLSLSVNSDL